MPVVSRRQLDIPSQMSVQQISNDRRSLVGATFPCHLKSLRATKVLFIAFRVYQSISEDIGVDTQTADSIVATLVPLLRAHFEWQDKSCRMLEDDRLSLNLCATACPCSRISADSLANRAAQQKPIRQLFCIHCVSSWAATESPGAAQWGIFALDKGDVENVFYCLCFKRTSCYLSVCGDVLEANGK